jgi:outer membrane biosynthesis protein TonB
MENEKRNKRIGFVTSLGVHAALLLLFLFAMAWRAPDPPLPEFGIIVNVGTDDEGSGDVQTDEPATEPVTQDDEPAEEPVETEPEPVIEDQPVADLEQKEVITSPVESPVVVKKEEEKVKEKAKDEPKVEPKVEPKKEPEKLKTEYKPEVTPKQNDNEGKKTESEGDDKNKTGNKGEPEGTLDPNGQYTGKPGGGGGGNGVSLSMSGWEWSEQPNTAGISNNESGRVVFEIECDADGEIIGIRTIERGVGAATEQLLRSSIMKTSLIRKSNAGQTPERSKGTVTFVIKSR